MHEVAVNLIRENLEKNLSIDNYSLSKRRFEERAYIRWAFNEILCLLYEEIFSIPEHISGRQKKGVFEIFDEFINKMEYFLSIGYRWGFDVAKHAAIQFEVYLRNTGLFEEEVSLLYEE